MLILFFLLLDIGFEEDARGCTENRNVVEPMNAALVLSLKMAGLSKKRRGSSGKRGFAACARARKTELSTAKGGM